MYTGATGQVSRYLDKVNQQELSSSGSLGNPQAEAIASCYLRYMAPSPSEGFGGTHQTDSYGLIQKLESEFYTCRTRYRQLLVEALERDCEEIQPRVREVAPRMVAKESRVSAVAFGVLGSLGGSLAGSCLSVLIPEPPFPTRWAIFTVGLGLLGAALGRYWGGRLGCESGWIKAEAEGRHVHPHLDDAVRELFQEQRRYIESTIAQLEEWCEKFSRQMPQNSSSSEGLQLERVVSYYKRAREELDIAPLEQQVAVIAHRTWVCYREGYIWGIDGQQPAQDAVAVAVDPL